MLTDAEEKMRVHTQVYFTICTIEKLGNDSTFMDRLHCRHQLTDLLNGLKETGMDATEKDADYKLELAKLAKNFLPHMPHHPQEEIPEWILERLHRELWLTTVMAPADIPAAKGEFSPATNRITPYL